MDILWRDAVGENAIWLMTGSSIVDTPPVPAISPDRLVADTGDCDGDGNSDSSGTMPPAATRCG
jgi:hypothetical protein